MNIIVISGATGVGTTSIASGIAQREGIIYIVGTDTLREAARKLVIPQISPYLHKSTYLAGKSRNYESKPELIKIENIIKGFKAQSAAVKVCIDGVVQRYIKEGSLAVVEGINALPGGYKELIDEGICRQVLIDLEEESLHIERIRKRMEKYPNRGNDYLKNIKEIRWIRDYLLRKAEDNKIPILNNSGSLDDAVNQCISMIH